MNTTFVQLLLVAFSLAISSPAQQHNPGQRATISSLLGASERVDYFGCTIVMLKNGIIHIYHLRNFDEVVVMNLSAELKKGQRCLELSSLFGEAKAPIH